MLKWGYRIYKQKEAFGGEQRDWWGWKQQKQNACENATVESITWHAKKNLIRKEDVSRTVPWASSTVRESLLQRVHDTDEKRSVVEEKEQCVKCTTRQTADGCGI